MTSVPKQDLKPRNGSQLLLESLESHGVKEVFGYPGGAIMPFYDELARSGLKHYLCSHCSLEFGPIDPETIGHSCDTSKPRYQNRGKKHDPITTSKKSGP